MKREPAPVQLRARDPRTDADKTAEMGGATYESAYIDCGGMKIRNLKVVQGLFPTRKSGGIIV